MFLIAQTFAMNFATGIKNLGSSAGSHKDYEIQPSPGRGDWPMTSLASSFCGLIVQ